MSHADRIQIAPSAARLTGSLRDIGYDFHTAVADLVDNSVTAGATTVSVEATFSPGDSYVLIHDDGNGMTESELIEALRFGTRRTYDDGDLGRFGLGLKTGTFSQCRRLTVVTRRGKGPLSSMTLDLNLIDRMDDWVVTSNEMSAGIEAATDMLGSSHGTVVVWEDLDRAVPDRHADTGWGRRRLNHLAAKTSEHLGLVFHRFLEGAVPGAPKVRMLVNGEEVMPWNPFAPDEAERQVLDAQSFEIETAHGAHDVRFQGFVLPPRDQFSSQEAFERLSGPLNWNRQQGLHIYRANRIVQFGGWNGVRGIDEHTKLARASLDFGTGLDEEFQINVAKMRTSIPPSLKKMLERPIHEVCVRADDVYRRAANSGPRSATPARTSEPAEMREVGIALKSALLETSGGIDQYRSVLRTLRRQHPELAKSLKV
ncbi:histidine kinase/DNA gyrase B/HSP90-like ATPase [Calidifontibacter indicus]|uniref:Histidine kinase/DNA gyrase B/HSP90-like ATPase n=1 Tax=Calidifontibacter indicus TaxID=419650 RepID=A0A3D9UJS2_9MICO|nr:histidine kinase/DNA gyrase B/HSP90-like ATPase [Calidifontibacter indicus]